MRQTALIYLHVTARLQLIHCFKRRTSHDILVNSQKQCSQVIQTQARKCDGMHMMMPFAKERASLYAKPAKPKLHLSAQSSPTSETPILMRILLRILRSSKYIKNTLN